MADLAAERNVNDEPVPINFKIIKQFLMSIVAQEASNHDSLPEKEKDTETPVKKRNYKPRGSPQTQALLKMCEASKYSDRVTAILARLEKDKTLLKNIFEKMKQNNIKIDNSQEGNLNTLSKEIDRIKSNIKGINELEAHEIKNMDIEIKKWERTEAQAKTKMVISIQNKSDLLEEAKEKAKQNKKAAEQRAKEEEDKFNREIQKIKDEEVKLETDFKEDLKAKKNELANTREQVAKNIKRMTEDQAKTVTEIDAKIQKLKEDEAKNKEEMDSNITAKRKQYEEFIKINENAKSKYEADIKYYNDKKARREKEMNLMLIKKNKLKESIQDITKKLSVIEADIKSLQEKETQMKFNLDGLAATKKEIEKKVETMEQHANAMRNELLTQQIKEKDKEIEKHTKEREKMLEVEAEFDRIVAQHEAKKKMRDENKMKRKLDPRDNELAKKKAGNLEYITANIRNNAQAKPNTESDEAKEQQQQETCEQIQLYIEKSIMRDVKTGKRNGWKGSNSRIV